MKGYNYKRNNDEKTNVHTAAYRHNRCHAAS